MSKKNKNIDFYDETLRDGIQSLWGARLPYGVIDAVADEIDQAGFSSITFPIHPVFFPMAVRAGEDPWEIMRLINKKIKKTKISSMVSPNQVNIFLPFEPPAVWRFFHSKVVEVSGLRRVTFMSNVADELERFFPTWFPFAKGIGLETCPGICYYPSPRTNDEYFVNLTKRVLKFKPDAIYLKDAGGLLTLEVAKTLLPAMMNEAHAQGIPIGIHTHGVSTNAGRVLVEAMKIGFDEVHTCTPPLANGTSHTSIFMALHNAKLLGLTHHINEEPLKVVEERLTRIAKQEGFQIGVPLEYDHGVYAHQVPGGVMGTLKNQLNQMGLLDKLDEVLEEVPRVLKDMGYPIMITPYSQYIVSQATVNVATGERYKEVLDCMIEMASGYYGVEDSGAAYMDQNIKDMLLSCPNAKVIAQKWARLQEDAAKDVSLKDIKTEYNMTNASDEDFLLHYIMNSDAEIKKMRAAGPPRSFYTGKEPLAPLLKALSKEKDISRLQLQKGNSFFDFRQK